MIFEILGAPITAPVAGFKFILQQLRDMAEKELYDPDRIREELLLLQMRLEEGEITEDEYKQLEEKITKTIAENDLSLRRQRTDFLNDEAQLYYETFNQIEQAVAKFAMRANIGIVLRFTREPLKADDPRALQAGIVSRQVIYQNRLDITDIVLTELNRDVPPPPTGNKAAAGATEGTATKQGQPAPRGGTKLR